MTGAEEVIAEPSSWPVTLTLCATVGEVNVAVYVPSPTFVTEPSEPAPTASVTVPPPVARFVPDAFFSCMVTVEVEELGEKNVRALLYVESESQKGILVGKRGAIVREIGTRARPEVEALVGHPVFLELVVKVRPKWRRDPQMLERLGL